MRALFFLFLFLPSTPQIGQNLWGGILEHPLPSPMPPYHGHCNRPKWVELDTTLELCCSWSNTLPFLSIQLVERVIIEHVPSILLVFEFLMDVFPNECLLLVKDSCVGNCSPTQVKHYVGGPSPCSMSLIVVPNFVRDVLQVLEKPKNCIEYIWWKGRCIHNIWWQLEVCARRTRWSPLLYLNVWDLTLPITWDCSY